MAHFFLMILKQKKIVGDNLNILANKNIVLYVYFFRTLWKMFLLKIHRLVLQKSRMSYYLRTLSTIDQHSSHGTPLSLLNMRWIYIHSKPKDWIYLSINSTALEPNSISLIILLIYCCHIKTNLCTKDWIEKVLPYAQKHGAKGRQSQILISICSTTAHAQKCAQIDNLLHNCLSLYTIST